MTTLHVSEAAALSIVEQADYYTERADQALAHRWEAAVDEAIRSLLRRPQIGSPCRFRSPALVKLRWTLVPGFPKHLIFYRYDETDDALFVVEVLHGARDIDSILSDEEDSK